MSGILLESVWKSPFRAVWPSMFWLLIWLKCQLGFCTCGLHICQCLPGTLWFVESRDILHRFSRGLPFCLCCDDCGVGHGNRFTHHACCLSVMSITLSCCAIVSQISMPAILSLTAFAIFWTCKLIKHACMLGLRSLQGVVNLNIRGIR